MATNATTRMRAWSKALTRYQTLNHRLDEAQPHEVGQLERALAAAQDELMELPAPSFLAVRQKLDILWELDVEKPDKDGAEKALIIEDLNDLIAEAAAKLGIE